MKGESVVILLVEDEPAHTEAIRRALKATGADVEIQTVGTLREYREAVTANPPDIALMDLNLPDGHAVDVLTSPPEDSPFPILIMTSHGNEQTAVEAIKAGALDYIVKSPEAFADIPRTVTHALRNWNLFRERKQAIEALRKSELKYRLMVENARDVVFQITPDGILTYVSPVVTAFGGYDFQEEIGQKIGKYFADPFQFEQTLAIMAESIEKQQSRSVEFLYQPKDHTPFWVEVVGKPIVENNQVTALNCIMRDITERKRAEAVLQESLERLRNAIQTTIQVLVLAVETKDPYTAGHQRRMTNLARTIATEMGLPPEKIEGLRMAGMIHDIGKIGLPAEILSKPTKLSAIEYSLLKEHARQGYEILKDVESPWPLAEIVYQHHERMDGSGYPRRLTGEEILIDARILAVADVVEAMASYRPCRPALGIDAALGEIEKNRGMLYDAAVVDTCLLLFKEKGFAFS